jgi:hypothetical protein
VNGFFLEGDDPFLNFSPSSVIGKDLRVFGDLVFFPRLFFEFYF